MTVKWLEAAGQSQEHRGTKLRALLKSGKIVAAVGL